MSEAVREQFVEAMRSVAATVTIVTASAESTGPAGLTATAVTSLSVEPPTMLVCVGRTSLLASALTEAGRFAVNVLGPAHEHLARSFAGDGGLRGRERFRIGTWGAHHCGTPVLGDAVASLVCQLDRLTENGTHLVAIGRVEHVGGLGRPASPLMYHHRRYVTVEDQPLPPAHQPSAAVPHTQGEKS